MTARSVAVVLFLALSSEPLYARGIPQAGIYKIGAYNENGSSAVGSAVLVAPGRLITNCHTVREAKRIQIMHPEGQVSATLARADYAHDLCLLEAAAFNGAPVVRVASTELTVGQRVIARGFGPGFRLSDAPGSITALYRYHGAFVVRTSAWFPKGASGGGLFDERGRLLGILTFRATLSDELNYAAPVEWVERILRQEEWNSVSPQSTAAFWEDDAPNQPAFLRAAWMEYEGAWQELRALATDWVLSQEDDAEAWIALGRARLGLRQDKEAVVALRRAVALQPDSSRAWYWLAVAYHAIGFAKQFSDASARLLQLDAAMSTRLSSDISTQTDLNITE